MKQAYIVKAYRTAVGKAPKGVFRFKRTDELAAETIAYMMKQLPELDPKQIDDVIVGNAMPEGSQGLNMARLISLMGLNIIDVPGVTVNRFCSSGIETIGIATAKIQAGMADCIIAGGAESMSVMAMGGWRIVPNAKVGKENPNWYWGMGLTAEAVAKDFNVSREDQDKFALQSQKKAIEAQKGNKFNEEIVNYKVKSKKSEINFNKDEHPRGEISLETLARLKPVFKKNGTVTAGNASGINDGAAAVTLMASSEAEKKGIDKLVTIKSWASCGVEPALMGTGPIPSSKKALEIAGWNIKDVDLFEINEAFAAQSLAVIKELKIPEEIVNVNGGAIALGHPIGASGTRILVTLIHEMMKRNAKKGLASLCIGGGMGIAMCIER